MKSLRLTGLLAVAFAAGALAVGFGFHRIGPGQSPSGGAETTAHDDEDHAGDEHAEHAEHAGHDEHEGEDLVHLSEGELEEFGVTVRVAGAGLLRTYVESPGEIGVNADRLAHIVPRVRGVVQDVLKTLGDRVQTGELMAVLQSRELADSKATFLASRGRLELAEANYAREERLWKKNISTEREYLEAKQTVAEAHISLHAAEQKLYVFGFSAEYVEALPRDPKEGLTRYQIVSPFAGTVIEKHITLGEMLEADTQAFVVADLSSVWVNLSIYQKDMGRIREGQSVVIAAGHDGLESVGEISYVGAMVGEQTRTALARVVIGNDAGAWRPGMFISARISVESFEVPLRVERSALQTVHGSTCVFVREGEAFKARPVTVGRSDRESVEITSGMQAGEEYVSDGGFTLKAQMAKGSFGDGHNH